MVLVVIWLPKPIQSAADRGVKGTVLASELKIDKRCFPKNAEEQDGEDGTVGCTPGDPEGFSRQHFPDAAFFLEKMDRFQNQDGAQGDSYIGRIGKDRWEIRKCRLSRKQVGRHMHGVGHGVRSKKYPGKGRELKRDQELEQPVCRGKAGYPQTVGHSRPQRTGDEGSNQIEAVQDAPRDEGPPGPVPQARR